VTVSCNLKVWAAVLPLLCFLTLPVSGQSLTVAITVDDLPCANCAPGAGSGSVSAAAQTMETTNRRLVAGLAAAQIPVTGFVIAQEVERVGATGKHSLQFWLNAGFDLGNHSYSHPNFADVTTEQMEADITRADNALRPLIAAKHRSLRFFRFPYNDTGDTQAKHDALAAFLREHSYQIATCTIDTSDYLFAQAYARAVGLKDLGAANRIRSEYLRYSATEIEFYAALNYRVLGYDPPQVMLIHDSLLNADTIDDLLALFRDRGYQFVSLTQAQSDPAYAIPDTYVTKYGPMWGYRWAQERKLGRLGLREPEPPDWITDYADGKLVDLTDIPNGTSR
jgi:peptidoglycan/xylan/chitin deacetylase (PgdA/CDA1 family)